MAIFRSREALLVFLGLYALALVLLLPSKPLWVDEIIDLGGVRNASDVSGLLAFVPSNAGGVPLGYLVDFVMIRTFGYSVSVVRFPSVLFTVLTCVGVFTLARQTGLRWPILAVVAYAISPMTFRYALEARPYAQAACWSVFASVMLLSLVQRPSGGKAAGYSVLVAAGLYTQPYSIFVPVAHLIWLVLVKRQSRPVWLAGTAVALASFSFLPWFFKIHSAWQGVVSSGVRFTVSGRDLLVIPHELMGTGYIGAGLTLVAVLVALGWSPMRSDDKFFLGLCALIPVVLVPAADAIFGYFLAARQLIFVLVSISILIAACAGLRRWGLLLPAVLLVAMAYEDVRWVRRPGEGWEPAASQLSQLTNKIADPGTCAMFVPSGARTMYLFYEPHIGVCNESILATFAAVALAISPDRPASAYADSRQELERAGFRKVDDVTPSGPQINPRIEVYRK
jgi:mannosyltransferase